jgi:hypothetical protein
MQIIYRMDNGTSYTIEVPGPPTPDQQANAMQSIQRDFDHGGLTTLLEWGDDWLTVNTAHVVAVEFTGGWEPET